MAAAETRWSAAGGRERPAHPRSPRFVAAFRRPRRGRQPELCRQALAIHGLIGPNGAGKTTTFNLISGFYAPSAGSVIYQGRDVSGMRTSALAALGLVRTFQGVTLFKEFTVIDNVRVGCHGLGRRRARVAHPRHRPRVSRRG
jgi:ABC-type branched-subunit amino acid transport system ATPase component